MTVALRASRLACVICLLFALSASPAMATTGAEDGVTIQYVNVADYDDSLIAGESLDVRITLANNASNSKQVSIEIRSSVSTIDDSVTTRRVPAEDTLAVTLEVSTSGTPPGKYQLTVIAGGQSKETEVTLRERPSEGGDDDDESSGDNDEEDDGESDESSDNSDSNVPDRLLNLFGVIVASGEAIGAITFFVGVLLYGTGTGGERTRRGVRLTFIGGVIFIFTFGAPTLVRTIQYLSPNLLFG